jgi:hypothetical protein
MKDRLSYANESEYKKIRNDVTKEIRKEKAGFEMKLAANIKGNNKNFYAYVRSKSKCKVKVGPLKGNEGLMISDKKGMAEILSKYFVQVNTKENLDNVPDVHNRKVEEEGLLFERVEINDEIVEGMIGKMKENRAAGVDGIKSTFIKKCCKGLVGPLREIFRESMRVGEIPDDWKLANVVAIFKKGARWDPGNYRPVSLTSQIGKIMEGIIKEKLVDYLEGNGLFGKSQHGFRKNRSCLTNLLRVYGSGE